MYSINREDLFLGRPADLEVCKVYQLTIKEILDGIGFEKYKYYVNLLSMELEDLRELLEKKGVQPPEELTVFDNLMISAANDDTVFLDLTNAISTFIKEEVHISPKTGIIIVGDLRERKIIDKELFFWFSRIIRSQNKLRLEELASPDENKVQKKFRLKRNERERIKAKSQKDSEDAAELADILSCLCVANIGVTPTTVQDLTLFQAKELLERVQAKETYHTELDMLMAGADSKKIKPITWVRNLTKEVNK